MKKLLFLMSFLPLFVFAAPTDLQSLIKIFTDMIGNSIIPLIGSLAFLVFLWGITKFISSSGDAKTHADGKIMMVWGIVGLFVMMSYLAIIRFANNDAGLGGFPVGGPRININNK